MPNIKSIREYGAVCDGIADDTEALRAAIAAAADGGTILLPEGARIKLAPDEPLLTL